MFSERDKARWAGTAPSKVKLKFCGEYPEICVGISATKVLGNSSPSSSMEANNSGFKTLPVLLGAPMMSTSLSWSLSVGELPT